MVYEPGVTPGAAQAASAAYEAASPKPLPAALAANACWFPSIGSEANNDATAITKMLNVIVVFESTVV